MDPDISRWCIEFLVRQEKVSDHMLNKILSGLAVATEQLSIQKELVIREIAGSVSEGMITESILNSLEKIEELDNRGGIKVAVSLKRAYCAAAVYCTTVNLEGSSFKQGKYLEAVDSIWRGRIRGLESRQSELVTDELKGWRDEVEAALWDAHARRRLLARPTNALHLVDAYLNEVLTIMGPPFLDVVAQLQTQRQRMVSRVKVRAQNLGNVDSGGVDIVGAEEPSSHANEGIEDKDDEQKTLHDGKRNQMKASGTFSGGHAYRVQREESQNAGGQSPSGTSVELRASKRRGLTRKPVIINDIDDEELPIEVPPRSRYDTLPSPEFKKVIESLKASALELQRVVRDPLPDALKIAEAVQSKLASISGQPVDLGSHSLKRSTHTDSSGHAVENSVPRPSLMERNVTAHTYEWDDSEDGSPQRIRLDDPKRAAISPLSKPNRRRKGHWTIEEEEALLQGVREYGAGNWKLIWNVKHDVLKLRSTVDLKDKWRNMQKHHRGYV